MKTKIFTLLLALAASVGTIFAQNHISGTCGENADWELKNGILYVTGSGAIDDYNSSAAPWTSWADEIVEIKIGNDITKIGISTFKYLTNLTTVSIGSGLTQIGAAAFEGCSSLISLICNSVTPPTCAASTVFSGINLSKVMVFVPKDAVSAYKAANVWKDFGDNIQQMRVKETCIYTIFVESTGTLTYYYDNKSMERPGVFEEYTADHFGTYVDKVTKAVIDQSMKDAQLQSTRSMFERLTKLTSIEGLENLNTSNVTDMSRMFAFCKSLQLENNAFRSFNTQNVTNMYAMFHQCEALKNIDISNFDTHNVTNMNSMFSTCRSLEWLDLRNFNVQNVTDLLDMFVDCEVLRTIYCNDDWSVKAQKLEKGKSYNMFSGCNKIQGGNGTKLDNNNLDITYARPDKPGQMGYFTSSGASIENVNQASEIKNQKLIINGQLFIQRGEEVFNAQGARVK